MEIGQYGGEILGEEDFLSDDFLFGDFCKVCLFLGFMILDLMLDLYLRVFEILCLDLWRESDGVSESSESELKSNNFVIPVIIVLVTVPKKTLPKAETREICFLRILLTVKELYELRSVLKANWRNRAMEK